IGAAMVPIAFAYGGWQTATFVSAEIRDPRRDLSCGLLLGVSGVVLLYLAVNVACLRVLGPSGLDATTTPASDLVRMALGKNGARWVALAITISALGFLSQSMLTAPRVNCDRERDPARAVFAKRHTHEIRGRRRGCIESSIRAFENVGRSSKIILVRGTDHEVGRAIAIEILASG